MPSEIAELLEKPAKKKKNPDAAMLALLLANRALAMIEDPEDNPFFDEEGKPDFRKAIPVITMTS